eukprot:TRINITY_DN1093_c0_g1_i12.p1 TRINITY_DN1093_c0_g1~~TRINITY_DN1093_c0_g1_i12.p1  ORF type:complete len:149 (-),score=9.43 TRINITY_DN1093_c0_g1_i12:100-546(-)
MAYNPVDGVNYGQPIPPREVPQPTYNPPYPPQEGYAVPPTNYPPPQYASQIPTCYAQAAPVYEAQPMYGAQPVTMTQPQVIVLGVKHVVTLAQHALAGSRGQAASRRAKKIGVCKEKSSRRSGCSLLLVLLIFALLLSSSGCQLIRWL